MLKLQDVRVSCASGQLVLIMNLLVLPSQMSATFPHISVARGEAE